MSDCTITYGNIPIILRRPDDGWDEVPVGPDQTEEHTHPTSSGDTTIYDLGQGSEEFSSEVLCANRAIFLAFAARRRAPHSFGDTTDPDLAGRWSMTFTGTATKNTIDGTHRVTARWKRVP